MTWHAFKLQNGPNIFPFRFGPFLSLNAYHVKWSYLCHSSFLAILGYISYMMCKQNYIRYLNKICYIYIWYVRVSLVLLVHLSFTILTIKCKIITGEFQKAYIYFVPFDSIHFRTVCLWKLLMLTTGVVFHDAIYQFIRIFYHSRFKPDNLQMTLVQWAMPVVDIIFLAGPLLQIKRWQHNSYRSSVTLLVTWSVHMCNWNCNTAHEMHIFKFSVFGRSPISSDKR